MTWAWLIGSAVLEAVWATALSKSEGFTHPWWVVLFVVAGVLSLLGLARALKSIPLGTGYAVWTGLGAALTVTWAMLTGAESVSVLKLVFLVGIVGAVVALKFLPSKPGANAQTGEEAVAEH